MSDGGAGARVQVRVWRGYGRAGRALGRPHAVYRPTGPIDPLAAGNRVADGLLAVFDARPRFAFQTPARHEEALRYLLADGAAVERGDYLVAADDGAVHFVADKPALAPIVAVRCNAVVSVQRLAASASWGVMAEPEAPAAETPLLSGWPASMLQGGRGITGGADMLPGGQPLPQYEVLLPAVPGLAGLPAPGDALVDKRGRRFEVGWSEASPLGWRLMVRLVVAV